jgi:hypothetical protein
LASVSARPGAEVIARSTPLARDEEQEAVVLQRRIIDGLVAAGREDLVRSLDGPLVAFALDGVPGIDQADVGRLTELNTKVDENGGCRCGVVAMRPDLAPADVSWLS